MCMNISDGTSASCLGSFALKSFRVMKRSRRPGNPTDGGSEYEWHRRSGTCERPCVSFLLAPYSTEGRRSLAPATPSSRR